jgi:hypothetical protein
VLILELKEWVEEVLTELAQEMNVSFDCAEESLPGR